MSTSDTTVTNSSEAMPLGGDAFAIDTFSLTRRYGDLIAADHVSLHVPYGSIFGLLGPNGAGKTTTIKMLTTMLEPSEGTASVPQALSADGGLTGWENLNLSAKLYGIPRAERKGRIEDALQFMALTDFGRKLVKTYSGGMIRRLEIAQAMLHRPAVLFLDEPTIGLDPVARRNVWERLLELRRNFQMTVLITTHAMDEADELCDHIAIMHLGKVAAIGTPADLKASVGPGATLDDVFVHFSGGIIQEEGNYRDVRATRRTVSRLG